MAGPPDVPANHILQLSPIVAVSFDIDGTLVDFERTMRNALGESLRELRRLAPNAAQMLTVESLIADREAVARALRGQGATLEEVRLAAFRRSLQQSGVDDARLAELMNAVFFHHRYDQVARFDDVEPTLLALRGEFRLGVISNGNSHPDRIGLADRFSLWLWRKTTGRKSRTFACSAMRLSGPDALPTSSCMLATRSRTMSRERNVPERGRSGSTEAAPLLTWTWFRMPRFGH